VPAVALGLQQPQVPTVAFCLPLSSTPPISFCRCAWLQEGEWLAEQLAGTFPWLKVVISMREPISQAIAMHLHNLLHGRMWVLRPAAAAAACAAAASRMSVPLAIRHPSPVADSSAPGSHRFASAGPTAVMTQRTPASITASGRL
jgi:hypothetical protein